MRIKIVQLLRQNEKIEHAFNSMYFKQSTLLTLKRFQGADTITILVRVNDLKVSQFKIQTAKFQPNEEDPMTNEFYKHQTWSS